MWVHLWVGHVNMIVLLALHIYIQTASFLYPMVFATFVGSFMASQRQMDLDDTDLTLFHEAVALEWGAFLLIHLYTSTSTSILFCLFLVFFKALAAVVFSGSRGFIQAVRVVVNLYRDDLEPFTEAVTGRRDDPEPFTEAEFYGGPCVEYVHNPYYRDRTSLLALVSTQVLSGQVQPLAPKYVPIRTSRGRLVDFFMFIAVPIHLSQSISRYSGQLTGGNKLLLPRLVLLAELVALAAWLTPDDQQWARLNSKNERQFLPEVVTGIFVSEKHEEKVEEKAVVDDGFEETVYPVAPSVAPSETLFGERVHVVKPGVRMEETNSAAKGGESEFETQDELDPDDSEDLDIDLEFLTRLVSSYGGGPYIYVLVLMILFCVFSYCIGSAPIALLGHSGGSLLALLGTAMSSVSVPFHTLKSGSIVVLSFIVQSAGVVLFWVASFLLRYGGHIVRMFQYCVQKAEPTNQERRQRLQEERDRARDQRRENRRQGARVAAPEPPEPQTTTEREARNKKKKKIKQRGGLGSASSSRGNDQEENTGHHLGQTATHQGVTMDGYLAGQGAADPSANAPPPVAQVVHLTTPAPRLAAPTRAATASTDGEGEWFRGGSSKKFRGKQVPEWKLDYLEEHHPHFKCPCSLELFDDPVVAEDGITYERKEIMTWLSKRLSSPSSNQPMGRAVVPNWSMKQMIEDAIEALPAAESLLTQGVWTPDPELAVFLKEKGFAEWRESRRRDAGLMHYY
jgi:hypothetical protein